MNSGVTKKEIIQTILIIGSVLVLWACFELVFQTRLVPYRNCWSEEILTILLSLKRFILMPMEPYAYVQSLAATLCLFGGVFLLGQKHWSILFRIVAGSTVVIVLLGTQSMSAWLAFVIMIVVAYYWLPIQVRCFYLICIGLALAALLWFFPYEFGTTQFTWLHMWHYVVGDSGTFIDQRGSFHVRFENLYWLMNHTISSNNWLLGCGLGSLMDMNRVPTSIYHGWKFRTDPGSSFIWFFEGGVLVGGILSYLILSSIWKGFRSGNELLRGMALGLAGFFIISLSSQTPYLWGAALVFVGMIEIWSRDDLMEGSSDESSK